MKENMRGLRDLEGHKQQEVEVRALLNAEQKAELLRTLEEKGATLEGLEYLMDTYLCPIGVSSFAEIEMDRVGSYSLRIRKIVVDGEETCEVNTKTITNQGDHNAWEEHEMRVDSYDEAMAIFHASGFKPYFSLEKERVSYSSGDMTVVVEDITDFGPVVEVEIITTKAKTEEAKKQIRGFLGEIGIANDQVVPKSVTNILMRQKARF